MSPTSNLSQVKKALIIHTGGGLGDVLLSTPVVESMAHHLAPAELHFLARRGTAAVLKRNPFISKLKTLPGKAPEDRRGFVRELRDENYDLALILWSVSSLAWSMFRARIPIRVGQSSRLTYSFLYTHKVKVRSEFGDDRSHWSDILLDYVRVLGLDPLPARVTYQVAPEAKVKAAELLAEHPLLEGHMVAFHLGKGMDLTLERWPVEAFASWARALQEELEVRLVLTGGPGEVELVKALQARLEQPVLNLAGATDLDTLAAVCRQCRLMVCPDSGPMHLAAAVGTPVVGIYALDEDFPRRWAPYGVAHHVVRPEHRNCRPGCVKATCPDFRCYHQVDKHEILAAAQRLLQEK